MPPGPPVLQTLVAEVYGPTEEARLKLAEQVRAIFKRTEGVVDVDAYIEADQPKARFVIDKEKAALHGVSALAVPVDALVRIDPHVQLEPVPHHHRRADVGDLQLRAAVRGRLFLEGARQRGQRERGGKQAAACPGHTAEILSQSRPKRRTARRAGLAVRHVDQSRPWVCDLLVPFGTGLRIHHTMRAPRASHRRQEIFSPMAFPCTNQNR